MAANIFPVTKGEVENTFEGSAVSEKPVMKLAAAGLTPISPVTAVVPVVEIADFARITKFPAVPRSTGAGPAATITVKAPEPDIRRKLAVICD